MKLHFLFLFFLLVCSPLLNGQDSLQGIFRTAGDFRNNCISYKPVANKKYKILLKETFGQPFIKITIGDSTYKLNKDSIFGYRDKQNTVHRFYNNDIYDLLNPYENILIYGRPALGGYKNTQTVIKYYFSSTASDSIMPLTKMNLKKAFEKDSSFHELLDLYFRNDYELNTYDSFYKQYKLNRIYHFSHQIILKQQD